ncbi:hypothetical protein [Mycolicibacterium fortuitum]|uniref:Uncharacterized protein n=1 Tax=Mycolicibacterium fortuitum TaxID=1766 RepID=A0AAE5AGC4_MYCFO|nr:hypothetical protein [Mycolicibacterium fortuitum]MDV7194766.1 hypothetical protein [Mycolicibacterium fortuitum]MDV7207669.1 hypothetical protein [Mycolicibacterium fortuitum]MDV7229725.1 hypothetical protein [Mycolicibacterium fortuitum]MDV7261522.1 hypothetical protein [Mycolicibacterium fortuitum]MDV7286698.1 hypothetical protein [Mycolicibacterium fortuitum]
MDLDADVWWGKDGGSRPNNPLSSEPGPSGVEAVLNAANANAAASAAAAPVRSDRERNLQSAVDDIRTWCHGYGLTGAAPVQEILNIIRSHHV